MKARRFAVCWTNLYHGAWILLSTIIADLLPSTVLADIQFQDVTAEAGFTYEGESWGAAWGDFNGDAYPDLWVTNHISLPALYVNQGDGTFLDVSAAVFPASVLIMEKNDAHGAAWADFDNDGDQDLIQLVGADLVEVGGSNPNQFLVNQGGVFEELAFEYGIDFSGGRGRMPLWLDLDNDGWLDLYNPTKTNFGTFGTALFRQTGLGFVDATPVSGLETSEIRMFAQLGDINGDSRLELLIEESENFVAQGFEIGGLPLQPVLFADDDSPVAGRVIDAIVADLDGDLDNDIFAVRGERNSDVVLTESGNIEGHFGPEKKSERGFAFKTTGVLSFDLAVIRQEWPLYRIYVGSTGKHPAKYRFELDSADASTHGVALHSPGVNAGIYIGYDPDTDQWAFLVSMPTAMVVKGFLISSTAPFDGFEAVGWDPDTPARWDRYFINSDGSFHDRTEELGIAAPTSSRSIVAGDFDNDMDLDLYLVSTGPVQNKANLLYENDGGGRLTLIPDAGGAAGTIRGRGDAVAMADYDHDGYLDLFVTNGKSGAFFDEDGPVQLFRNLGSGNHWIQFDLEGVISNRNGIGARVLVTAGGITQVREQTAGIHARAQNHQRIHFGLGSNVLADEIQVRWPSGVVQYLVNVSADQIIKIREDAVAINDPPEISAIDDQTIDEDVSTGDLSFRAGDLGSAPASIEVTAASNDQSLIPDSNLMISGHAGTLRSINVTPAADRSGGPVKITLAVSDGAQTTLSTFNVTVLPINDRPVAVDDSFILIEEDAVRLDLLANDHDIDSLLDRTSLTIVTGPSNGDLAQNLDGTVQYTPLSGAATSDTFSYTVNDEDGATSNVAVVSINAGLMAAPDEGLSTEEAVGLGLDPDAAGGDTDGDGLPDHIEVGVDSSSPLDSDGDGLIDALEPGSYAVDASVAAGLRLINGTTVTISTAPGELLSRVSVNPGSDQPNGIRFPFGTIGYSTTSPIGGDVPVRFEFSTTLPEKLVLYKVDDPGAYGQLSPNVWVQKSARAVEVVLRDGAPETDHDGTINGVIDDPIAFGEALSDSSGGGGGGCVAYPASKPDLIFPLVVLVALFRLGDACVRRRLLSIDAPHCTRTYLKIG